MGLRVGWGGNGSGGSSWGGGCRGMVRNGCGVGVLIERGGWIRLVGWVGG